MRISRPVLVTACGAAVVTVAGLVFALSQRLAGQDAAAPSGDEGLRCGSSVCQSVTSQRVGTDTVELLAGTSAGRIRVTGASGTYIFELTIAESGARVTPQSLQCEAAQVNVCLVRGQQGTQGTDLLGEVLIGREGTWSRVQAPYLASGDYLGLHDVNRDAVADVVAVQKGCDGQCELVFAQVFSVVGDDIGCTARVARREQLPGWPTPTPDLSHLRPCTKA